MTLFAQVIQLLPKEIIKGLIKKYGVDKYAKGFGPWEHLVCMIFCQFADCESLRDISNGLRSAGGNLNHLGMGKAPGKSTIAYQNERRPPEFFRDCYYALLEYFGQQLRFPKKRFCFKNPVKLLDSSVITLCAELFDWAYYTHAKGAIKMHTLLNLDMRLPDFVNITEGNVADSKAARDVEVAARSIVVADRGYFDTDLLNLWDSRNVFFVVRVKDNMIYERVRERELPEKKHQDVLIDEEIMLTGTGTRNKYPKKLRRVAVFNEEHGYTVVLVTNNFKLAASTIAELYKCRWLIETFFKTIKQNLHIKSFIGTSRNAVETQIWTALITILLIALLKAKSTYKWAFSNLVASLRLNTFVKIDLMSWLNEPFTPPPEQPEEAIERISGDALAYLVEA